jgi:hypothetical protein
VVRMVTSEGDGRGQAHGDVTQHGHELVEGHIAASAKVGEVVNAAVQRVREESTDEIGVQQNEPHRHFLYNTGLTLDR